MNRRGFFGASLGALVSPIVAKFVKAEPIPGTWGAIERADPGHYLMTKQVDFMNAEIDWVPYIGQRQKWPYGPIRVPFQLRRGNKN